MSKTIALVACVIKKQDRPMPARDLYTSPLFRKASAYAQRVANEWFILSIKHGLVPPDRVIAPFDETLMGMPVKERRAWARRVMAELAKILAPGDHVVMLAGERYREELMDPIREMGCTVEVPLAGLRMGEQLHWLSRRLA